MRAWIWTCVGCFHVFSPFRFCESLRYIYNILQQLLCGKVVSRHPETSWNPMPRPCWRRDANSFAQAAWDLHGFTLYLLILSKSVKFVKVPSPVSEDPWWSLPGSGTCVSCTAQGSRQQNELARIFTQASVVPNHQDGTRLSHRKGIRPQLYQDPLANHATQRVPAW